MDTPRLLAIDDDEPLLDILRYYFTDKGFAVDTALSGEDALEIVKNKEFAVAIVDLNLPGMSGIDCIGEIKKIHPDTQYIILTGFANLQTAIDGIKEGVFDYMTKPAELDQLFNSVKNAAEKRSLMIENRNLIRELETERSKLKEKVAASGKAITQHISNLAQFIGESEKIRLLREAISEVAPTDMSVLVRGESGTGKDVIANLIHEWSGRQGSFVKINCPAITETLLESEMFGHEKGAFTGAVNKKPGRIEFADNGTIFLDEIGTVSPAFQAKLLQVIEHKTFTRLGGRESKTINARFIAATNADLEKMIEDNQFRADLLYRLAQYTIEIPPLRDRRDDIPLLVQHYLQQFGARHGNEHARPMEAWAMARLVEYDWPGNVRELKSFIERFALKYDYNLIEQLITKASSAEAGSGDKRFCDDEQKRIMAALIEVRWNRRKAAELLHMSYSTLRRKLAKLGITEQETKQLHYH